MTIIKGNPEALKEYRAKKAAALAKTERARKAADAKKARENGK